MMRNQWIRVPGALTFAVALASAAFAAPAHTPWEAHGPLKVSSNGRFLQHRDGTPFLWLGDTAWALFFKLNREEVRAYLDDRQQKGFNVIQAVAYWYPHGEDGPGPLNAPNAYGHRPFEGGDDDPQTARPGVVRGGSPDNPNDYWDHADFIVREIRARGMYLALLPCWGRAFINSTFENSRPTLDESGARAYGRFLGHRYRKQPHIVWVIGGDINPTKGASDRRAIYRVMAESIGRGVTGAPVRWDQAHRRWDVVLMTYHPDGDPMGSSAKFFHAEPWLDVNGVQTFKSVDKVQAAIAANYNRKDPVKPILLLEGAYERGRYQAPGGEISDLKVRRQAWQAMLAGAAGHTYGASSIWHFQRRARGTTPAGEWIRALNYPAAPQVAAILGRILTDQQWWTLIPDQDLLLNPGKGETLKVAARSADGRRLLVYFPDSSSTRLSVSPAPAAATWIRPQDGSRQPASANATSEFTPPDGWPDALLAAELVPASARSDAR